MRLIAAPPGLEPIQGPLLAASMGGQWGAKMESPDDSRCRPTVVMQTPKHEEEDDNNATIAIDQNMQVPGCFVNPHAVSQHDLAHGDLAELVVATNALQENGQQQIALDAPQRVDETEHADNLDYCRAVAALAARYNLSGKPSEDVNDEEAETQPSCASAEDDADPLDIECGDCVEVTLEGSYYHGHRGVVDDTSVNGNGSKTFGVQINGKLVFFPRVRLLKLVWKEQQWQPVLNPVQMQVLAHTEVAQTQALHEQLDVAMAKDKQHAGAIHASVYAAFARFDHIECSEQEVSMASSGASHCTSSRPQSFLPEVHEVGSTAASPYHTSSRQPQCANKFSDHCEGSERSS